MIEAREFEQQIERIHRAISGIDAQVTWDDHVPGPDNPNQPRQIDVMIRRGDHLTVIECRHHKTPQDVTWIEQLFGRRASLRADAIVGVSSSGFTVGATRKAEALGVFLRDFATVTPEEAQHWGEPAVFWIVFYEFRDLTFFFEVPAPISARPMVTTLRGEPINFSERDFLMKFADRYDLNKAAEQFIKLQGELRTTLLVDGVPTSQIQYRGRMRGRRQETLAPSVGIYSDPNNEAPAIEARVDKFPGGQTEVIKGPELASIALDLSSVRIPARSIMGFPGFTQPGGLRLRNFRITGTANVLKSNVDVVLEFRSRR